jgi:DNA-directed RNA polymerase subunit RPC12/RpoP
MASHTLKCSKCGTEFTTTSWRAWKRGLCLECSVRKTYENAQQLHDHSGPAYEKWKKAMKHAARGL